MDPGLPAGDASWALLYWLLLVADAADVRRRGRESRVDAGLGSLNGHRKEPTMGPTHQRPVGRGSALLGTRPRPGSSARVTGTCALTTTACMGGYLLPSSSLTPSWCTPEHLDELGHDLQLAILCACELNGL